jgi:hypothetical protein
MKTPFVDIVFEGSKFSPRKLKATTGLRITSLAESGEISTRGRYKGKLSPYGLATLKIESATEDDLEIIVNSAIQYLTVVRDSLASSGVEEVSVDNEWSDGSFYKLSNRIYKSIEKLNKLLSTNNQSATSEFGLPEFYSNKFEVELLNLYSAFCLKENNRKFFHYDYDVKLTHLFSNVLESDISYFQINREKLIETVILYLFYYKDTEPDQVPSFKEILKEIY